MLALRVRRLRLVAKLIAVSGLYVLASNLTGCGSIESNGTPPGTYNFVVTASGRTGVSQFVEMTMTISK
jgi:hypothetical protein